MPALVALVVAASALGSNPPAAAGPPAEAGPPDGRPSGDASKGPSQAAESPAGHSGPGGPARAHPEQSNRPAPGTTPAARPEPRGLESPRAAPAANRAAPAAEETPRAEPRRRVRIRSVGRTRPLVEPVAEGQVPRSERPVRPAPRGPSAPRAHADPRETAEARDRGPVAGRGAPAAPQAEPAASVDPPAPVAPDQPAGTGRSAAAPPSHPLPVRVLPRAVRQIVEVVPREIWAALAGLGLLALALAASSWLTAVRARRLSRQRAELLEEVGLLQAALLPPVPAEIPVSVAYRPAEGPAAGGDFYDAFALDGDRTGLILGDVSGHGRDALARTAFVRYTLRAYLEAGLEPREVLKVGSEALSGRLGSGFATVVVALHEPASGRFTYASAGHAPPIVVGDEPFEPVHACPAPPVAFGDPTGFRQTTITLTAGSLACLYTDGVTDVRRDGRVLGVARLERALAELGPDADAHDLVESIAAGADSVPDDMAVCLVRADERAPATGARIEELEVDERGVGDSLEHFLRACGVPLTEVPGVLREAGEAARRDGSATVRVRLNDFRPGVDVVPGNVVRLEPRRALRQV